MLCTRPSWYSAAVGRRSDETSLPGSLNSLVKTNSSVLFCFVLLASEVNHDLSDPSASSHNISRQAPLFTCQLPKVCSSSVHNSTLISNFPSISSPVCLTQQLKWKE